MTAITQPGNLETVTEAPDSRSTFWAWYTLIIAVLQTMAMNIDLAIVSVLVHPIEAALRINDVRFAASTAMPIAIGLAIMFYPAGLLADSFRRRDMVAAGVIMWALAAFIASRADSGTMLFLARFLAGVGTALPTPAIFSMLTDAFSRKQRAFAVGMYYSGASVGFGIGLTICGALVEATNRIGIVHLGGLVLTPWQECFIVVGAIGILVLALIMTVPEPARAERLAVANTNLVASVRVFGQYLRRHWLLWSLLILGTASGLTSWYTINAWGPALGLRHYGVTGVSSIALLGTCLAGGSLLGSVVGGLFTQRGINRGDHRILPRMLVAVSLISVLAAGFPYLPTWLLAVVGMGLMSAVLNLMCILITIAIQETATNEVRGQLYGLWGFVIFLPSIGAATVVAFLASGVLAKAGGLGSAMAIVGGITCVVSVLLFAFIGAPYERARHELAVASSGTHE